MMFKSLINDKKGAAEVVGTVMFIVILMFFFTNVYLWHDAAVKEMNDLYAEKLNSQIRIIDYNSTGVWVENVGGVDATIECYWIDHEIYFPNAEVVVRAGTDPVPIPVNGAPREVIKVVTTTGNIAKWEP
jgi:hypothetical protein